MLPCYLILLLFVLAYLGALSLWYGVWPFFGKRAILIGLSTFKLRMKQPFRYGTLKYYICSLLFVSPFFIFLLVLMPEYSWCLILPILTGISTFFYLSLPPVALFLGTSSKAGKKLYSIVSWNCTGHTISMLRSPIVNIFSSENMRTTDRVWHETVQKLSLIAPIVIVDARMVSESVMFEAQLILNSIQSKKAIFVIGDDGKHPLLDAIGFSLSKLEATGAKFVNESGIKDYLAEVEETKKLKHRPDNNVFRN